MALIELVDNEKLNEIKLKLQKETTDFKSLNVGTKAKVADSLFLENRVLKELGMVAIDTIEKMDEEIEMKDNKINALENELKITNHYDQKKIEEILYKNTSPVIRNDTKERAKRRLMKTLSIANK